MSTYFAPSELIINSDGSCFHLHLKPEQLADKVILVGDPGRVDLIAGLLDSVECTVSNREFRTATGLYKGKRVTIQSTRTEKPVHRTLDIVRIGTCGGLQPFTPLGTYLCSVKSIGFDGLLNFYAGRDEVCDLEFERAFVAHMEWSTKKGAPYVANANPDLLKRIMADDDRMVPGVTIACNGFYGPQGRVLRAPLADPNQNAKVESFEYKGMKITNFEMESSAVAGLSALLGHRAMTVCMVIANRYAKEMNTDYKPLMKELIIRILDRI